MQIIQYMSIQRGPLLHRLMQKMIRQESTIVLDLEDTLNSIDRNEGQKIKAWGRAELIQFAHDYPSLFKNKKVGIRVNGLRTGEFEYDLKTLSEISQIWDLHCIIGPKIDSIEDIQTYISSLREAKVNYHTFIPIIESIRGIQNLAEIVSHASVTEAVYGHHDYCLDLGHWPFFEQDEVEFWDIASSFIQKIEKAGVRYIHPPISSISNESFFTHVYLRLKRLCHLPFSIITINSAQTALFNRLKNTLLEIPEKELRSASSSMREKVEQALYVKKVCSTRKRNFRIDPMTGKFFSPHKYIAALQFLEQLNE